MMKRILCILSILCVIDLAAMAQSTPPLCVSEIDGSPSKCGITRIKVSNGSLIISGNTATITTGGGGGGLTVGTTAIASGTAGRFLYETSGNVLGEVSTLTSDGSVLTMTRAGIGTTSTDGIALTNSTAAAAGAQQYSPRLRLTGQGWKTNATAASQQIDFNVETRTFQSTVTPNGALTITATINGTTQNVAWFGAKPATSGQPASGIFGLDTAAATAIDTGTGFAGWGSVGAANIFAAYANASPVLNVGSGGGSSGVLFSSSGLVSWTSGALGATIIGDTALARAAAGVIRATNGSTGAGGILVGSSSATGTAGSLVVASANADSLTVGPNGLTNPILQVVGNVASAATGLSITGNAAGSGVTLTALSSGTDESILFAPKGTGGVSVSSSAITSGNLVSIAATGTAAASNTKTALNVATSGANATSTQTTYGARFANTSTGTGSTNVGIYATASGGTNNYAGILAGRVGVNNTAPLAPLHVGNAAVLSSVDAQILASQTVDNSGAGNAHGFSDSSQIQRSGTIGYASFDARAAITGNGGYNYDHTVGFQSAISHATIGTITAIYGFYSQPSRSNGPVTNIYGYYAAAPVFSSGGSATSGNYGLYVEDLGTSAGIYSIYTNGTTASRFGGSVTVAGSLLGGNAIQAGATSYIYWATSTSFRNRSDGVLTLSNFAENDFTRLQLGGTTSSFPALGRSGAALAVLAADGTAGTLASPARTPAQITADQNNYAPGVGWFQRWSSDASRNVTGLAAGVDGQVAEIWNVGSNNIVFVNESASSTAANRFTTSTGADLTLSAAKCAQARYDSTSARWRVRLCN